MTETDGVCPEPIIRDSTNHQKNKKRGEKEKLKIDLENCKNCLKSRCILYNGVQNETLEQREERLFELKVQKRIKQINNKKKKAYWIKETAYWNKIKIRESKLANYERKPRMNKTDWRHDQNWFIAIEKIEELAEKYYNSIEY